MGGRDRRPVPPSGVLVGLSRCANREPAWEALQRQRTERAREGAGLRVNGNGPRGPSRGRRLPVRLAPAEGEAFSSYADRLAGDLGVPLSALLSATGAFDRSDGLPCGYGVVLARKRVEAFAHATGLDVRRVEKMLVGSLGLTVFGRHDLGVDVGSSARFLTLQWVYLSASHVCPACLRDSGGVWKLAWKLPWSWACVRHRRLLVGVCPGCGRRTGAGRADRRTAPNYLGAVPVPGLCANPPTLGTGRVGRAARACGYPLADAPSPDLGRQPAVLAAQRALDAALDGRPQTVGGEIVSAPDYFGAMRSLCALILYAARPDDLPVVGSLGRVFETHVRGRDELDLERGLLVGGGRDGRAAPRARCFSRVPDDPALMAAIAPTALRSLAVGSSDALVDAIAPFVARAQARNRAYAGRLPGDFSFPTSLRCAYERSLVSRRTFVRQTGMQAQTGEKPRRYGFTADEIPQLLWEEVCASLFLALIPGTRDVTTRRFCSMALVKLVRRCTWDEAAVALGLSDCTGSVLACALVSRLTRAGTADLFATRLEALARRLDTGEALTNYGARRRALAEFVDIEALDWRNICASAASRPGKPGGRRRFAAAWLWVYLTEGDHRLAPALQAQDASSERDCYRRFVMRDLPGLRPELARYGASLAASLGLGGEANWSEPALGRSCAVASLVSRLPSPPRSGRAPRVPRGKGPPQPRAVR